MAATRRTRKSSHTGKAINCRIVAYTTKTDQNIQNIEISTIDKIDMMTFPVRIGVFQANHTQLMTIYKKYI